MISSSGLACGYLEAAAAWTGGVFSVPPGGRPQKDTGRKCSGTAHVTSSPDIRDPLCQGVWKMASKEAAWSEACLGQKCFPEGRGSVRLGGDAGAAANPSTFPYR